MSDDPGALRRRGYATNINDATDGLSNNRTHNSTVDNLYSTTPNTILGTPRDRIVGSMNTMAGIHEFVPDTQIDNPADGIGNTNGINQDGGLSSAPSSATSRDAIFARNLIKNILINALSGKELTEEDATFLYTNSELAKEITTNTPEIADGLETQAQPP